MTQCAQTFSTVCKVSNISSFPSHPGGFETEQKTPEGINVVSLAIQCIARNKIKLRHNVIIYVVDFVTL